MKNSSWKIQLNLLSAIIWKNILEYRRYPLEIAFTFLMPIVWFLPTYFLIISFAPQGTSRGLASWIGTDNFFSFYMIGLIVGYFTATIFWISSGCRPWPSNRWFPMESKSQSLLRAQYCFRYYAFGCSNTSTANVGCREACMCTNGKLIGK